MKIVVLDGYAANPGDLCWDELQALGECTIYDRTAPAEVLERAAGAEILLTNKTVLTADHIAALPELKYIGVLATGYNIVDIDAAKERGIIVTNIPAYSTDSVAQMVFAHILNIAQQVQHHSEEVHRGRWTNSQYFCFWDTPLIELRGKKLGIVGLGHTGYTTARIAIGFGMQVCTYTSKTNFQLPPEIRKMELDELFRECDIISLHRLHPRNGERRTTQNDEAHRFPHQHRTRSAHQRTRPGRCTEQRYHLCRRTGRPLPGTSPCRQPAAHRPQLLHHPAHSLGKHCCARTPHANHAGKHQSIFCRKSD